jgi:HEAT repeat protein
MDKTIGRICGMLQSPDGMRRCAAAMVLTELAPRDAAVIKALGEALKDANQLLTRYILEAFDVLGSRTVVAYVLPLLDAEDMETKLRAAAIVARAGSECLPELKRQFEKASSQQKRVLVDILARIHSRDAMQLILNTLSDTDFELVKEACQAVRRHIGDAAPKDRTALHKQIVKFMGTGKAKENDRVLTSCLLLVGHVGSPDAHNVLLKYTQPKQLGYIRRNALIGLKSVALTGSAVNAVTRQVLKYLTEDDPIIVQLALDLLEKYPPTGNLDAQWRKLLKSKQPIVRTFAARKLAVTDTPAGNKLMLELLGHEDPAVSEIAASALARHKHASKLLLDALAKEKKPEAAWRLAKIFKPHSDTVTKPILKKFASLAARELASGHERNEALLYFLRNVDQRAGDDVVRDVGMKFKKARKWAHAVACLRQLARSDSFDADLRFELSVCNLKASPKDLAPHLRFEDHALRGFQSLMLDKNFKLLERLKKESALEAADFYYLGFHFCEGTAGEAKLGRELLEHVAKRWPKSKEGKDAKSKLKLVPQEPAGS